MATARCLAVAYSGGRDSTALLHSSLKQASLSGEKVFALHVHHGLSPRADAWLAFCEAQCQHWAQAGLPVELVCTRLEATPSQGESVEAWARQRRYEALGKMALEHGASVVLLAHHRRDQAETFVLQALRGAGMAGLASMPASAVRTSITWERPWLFKSRDDIEAYVRRHCLQYIDDDSNSDRRFARNRLRLDVWPALAAAFPQAESSLAQAAQWAHEAQLALSELATMDLSQVSTESGVQVASWLQLSTARRSNALRAWLQAQNDRGAPAALVTRLMKELPGAAGGRWSSEDGELRLYRGTLTWISSPPFPPSSVPRELALSVHRVGTYPLPGWGGCLHVRPAAQCGVPLAWIAHLELRPRVGSEKFQSGIDRPPRSLKKQFQSAGVPQWDRSGPLIYSGGQLVYVPGLGLDARLVGLPGQPTVELEWLAAAADTRVAGPASEGLVEPLPLES